MPNKNILWIDDEIDLLKMHILFLREKGYTTATANNGHDALEILQEQIFDIILLDENMPGISGLDLLPKIKRLRPITPVVMITKNEEEDIMDEAIGDNIDDYLLKPVNPKQILLSIKKNAENKQIINDKVRQKFQSTFRALNEQINDARSPKDWNVVYKELVYWEMELERSNDKMLNEILIEQMTEVRNGFSKFISKNYISWFNENEEERPPMIHEFMKKKIKPLTDAGEKVFVIVIDNLRFDQWRTIRPVIEEYMEVINEEIWYSILPTVTQYARNAFFAGLMPSEIEKRYPEYWSHDHEEGGKNKYEEKLLREFFKRYRRNVSISYEKVLENDYGVGVNERFNRIKKSDLSVVVYNFIDMLSHARTDNKMVQELAHDLSKYRRLTKTWLLNSPLFDLIKLLSEHNIRTFITTDHGSVNINRPVKVIGDKETSTNLRYKSGKNLKYKKKDVFEITEPEKAGLPSYNLSQSYIFAQNNDFLAYPNNYNYYVRYYKDTFQHGGVSPDEMLIPVIELKRED
ncbi:MAG: PglZ domain-containing protein [Bacteroidota bacterium]|nr:PglZ domain-containing protein [Bacteroidota bacterium]